MKVRQNMYKFIFLTSLLLNVFYCISNVFHLVRLILRPREQILASLSDKSAKEDSKEPDDKTASIQQSSENDEASKSVSESEEEDDEPGVLSYIM